MKIKLATQLLRNSVADSLLYCKNILILEAFQNCTETIEFIKIMNAALIFYINSHKIITFDATIKST